MASPGSVLFLVAVLGLQFQTQSVYSFTISTSNAYVCQGSPLPQSINCNSIYTIVLRSISIITAPIDTAKNCSTVAQLTSRGNCVRKIQAAEDEALPTELMHLFQWVYNKCQGKKSCDPFDNTMPEWWYYIDDNSKCVLGKPTGLQYFMGVLIDHSCVGGDSGVSTVGPPPSTTLREKPTTPTTTTPFPVFFNVYQPELTDIEKIILGVAIGLAIAILIMIIIVLYCCERYRHSKRFRRILKMLGAPTAEDDPFDDLDYGRRDGWDDTVNEEALGEYTGVKPNEFMTLDKKAMISSGQIMYDTLNSTMKRAGNSCATLDRTDRKPTKPDISMEAKYTGPVDYTTQENIELEQRMLGAQNYDNQ